MNKSNLENIKSTIEARNLNSKNSCHITLNTEGVAPFVEANEFAKIDGICHGFSTKFGGVSQGIFESMNLGLYLGDDKEKVIENYRRFSSSLGIDYRKISCPNQVHSANVLLVKKEDSGDGITRELSHKNIDGQITNIKGIPLIVYWADCVPILFADPVKKAIGAAHAGWRGTVAGIAAKTIEKMQESFGCNPKDIYALIGPSIGIANYEVDDLVINGLKSCPYINTKIENPEELGLYQAAKEDGKYMFNLQKTNEFILEKAGLDRNKILNMNLCTMEYHDIFFSHRYTQGKRGLNAGIIQLL